MVNSLGGVRPPQHRSAPATPPTADRSRGRLSLALKLSVTLAAALLICLTVDVREAAAKLGELGPSTLIVAFVLLTAQSVVAAWRWHKLLCGVGAETRFLRDLQIYMSASVANLAFLPQIGSMSVRAYLAVRDGVGLGPAIGSLVLERLFVLFAISVAFVLGAGFVTDRIDGLSIRQFLLMGLAGILFTFVVTGLALRLIGREHVALGIERLKPLVQNPGRTAAIAASSLFVLYSGFAAVAVIAIGLNADVPWMMLFAIQPVVAVLAALPISIGGWGVREGGMVVSLGLVGVSLENALAISVATALAGCVTTLVLAAVVQAFHSLNGLARRSRPVVASA